MFTVGRWVIPAAGILSVLATPYALEAANAYTQHNLISDLAGMADHVDANLVNPWGICYSPTSPFWLANNGSGTSTLYSSAGSGAIPGLVVSIPSVGGPAGSGTPSGCVFNGTSSFAIASGKPGFFIFSTEDGTISGWNSGVNASAAVIMVDNSSAHAVYKGLAIGSSSGNDYLYATNFNAGTVDVFDANYQPVKLPAGAFTDPSIPAGFAPFGIQPLNGNLYVTYALQDSAKHDDVAGPGNGYVDVYTMGGTLVSSLIAGGSLNSPWGLAIAPAAFGDFAGDLLVGNFGSGWITVYDPAKGTYIATLNDSDGNPISVPGLWGLIPGNGGNGGDKNAVYFTAGIYGPSGIPESDGLFGSLQAAPSFTSAAVVNAGSLAPGLAANTFITITGNNLASTTRTWQASDFVDGALPVSLDGVNATIDGRQAYVYYISPTQLNLLTPADATTGQVSIVTRNHGIASSSATVQLQTIAPSFFLDKGYIAATHADGSYVGPTTLVPGLTTPAAPGETIALYGTGFGDTNPEYPSGTTFSGALPLPVTPAVTFGGAPATVAFAGLTGVGLYQINVVVPAGTPDGDTVVVASLNGQSTQATALVTVQTPPQP